MTSFSQYEWYQQQKAIRVMERQQKIGASNLLNGYRTVPDQDISLGHHKQLNNTKLQQLARKQSAIRHRNQYGIINNHPNNHIDEERGSEEQQTNHDIKSSPTKTSTTSATAANEIKIERSSPPKMSPSGSRNVTKVARETIINVSPTKTPTEEKSIAKTKQSPRSTLTPPPLFALSVGTGNIGGRGSGSSSGPVNALDEWRKQQKLLKDKERKQKQSSMAILSRYRAPQTNDDKTYHLQKQIQHNKVHQLARKESAIRNNHQYGIHHHHHTTTGGMMMKTMNMKQQDQVQQRQEQEQQHHMASRTTTTRKELLLSSIEESLASPELNEEENSIEKYTKEEVDAAAQAVMDEIVSDLEDSSDAEYEYQEKYFEPPIALVVEKEVEVEEVSSMNDDEKIMIEKDALPPPLATRTIGRSFRMPSIAPTPPPEEPSRSPVPMPTKSDGGDLSVTVRDDKETLDVPTKRTVELDFHFGLLFGEEDETPSIETCQHAALNIIPNTIGRQATKSSTTTAKQSKVSCDPVNHPPRVTSVHVDPNFTSARTGIIRFIVTGKVPVLIHDVPSGQQQQRSNEEDDDGISTSPCISIQRQLRRQASFRKLSLSRADRSILEKKKDIIVGEASGDVPQWRQVREGVDPAWDDLLE